MKTTNIVVATKRRVAPKSPRPQQVLCGYCNEDPSSVHVASRRESSLPVIEECLDFVTGERNTGFSSTFSRLSQIRDRREVSVLSQYGVCVAQGSGTDSRKVRESFPLWNPTYQIPDLFLSSPEETDEPRGGSWFAPALGSVADNSSELGSGVIPQNDKSFPSWNPTAQINNNKLSSTEEMVNIISDVRLAAFHEVPAECSLELGSGVIPQNDKSFPSWNPTTTTELIYPRPQQTETTNARFARMRRANEGRLPAVKVEPLTLEEQMEQSHLFHTLKFTSSSNRKALIELDAPGVDSKIEAVVRGQEVQKAILSSGVSLDKKLSLFPSMDVGRKPYTKEYLPKCELDMVRKRGVGAIRTNFIHIVYPDFGQEFWSPTKEFDDLDWTPDPAQQARRATLRRDHPARIWKEVSKLSLTHIRSLLLNNLEHVKWGTYDKSYTKHEDNPLVVRLLHKRDRIKVYRTLRKSLKSNRDLLTKAQRTLVHQTLNIYDPPVKKEPIDRSNKPNYNICDEDLLETFAPRLTKTRGPSRMTDQRPIEVDRWYPVIKPYHVPKVEGFLPYYSVKQLCKVMTLPEWAIAKIHSYYIDEWGNTEQDRFADWGRPTERSLVVCEQSEVPSRLEAVYSRLPGYSLVTAATRTVDSWSSERVIRGTGVDHLRQALAEFSAMAEKLRASAGNVMDSAVSHGLALFDQKSFARRCIDLANQIVALVLQLLTRDCIEHMLLDCYAFLSHFVGLSDIYMCVKDSLFMLAQLIYNQQTGDDNDERTLKRGLTNPEAIHPPSKRQLILTEESDVSVEWMDVVTGVKEAVGVLHPAYWGLNDLDKKIAEWGKVSAGISQIWKLAENLAKFMMNRFAPPLTTQQLFEERYIDIYHWMTNINEVVLAGGVVKVSQDVPTAMRASGFYNHGVGMMREFLSSSPTREVKETFMRFLSIAKELSGASGSVGNKTRQAPVVIWLGGAPGVGKSSAVNAMVRMICDRNGITDHEYQRYARPPCDDYWEGYHGQYVLSYDDIFQSDAIEDRRTQAMEIIHAAGDAPYALNMASLEAKGKFFMSSKIIVLTSNTLDINQIGLTELEAFERRIDLKYEVTVDPQYANELGRIDLAKLESVTGVPNDYNVNVLRFKRLDRHSTMVEPHPQRFSEVVDKIVHLTAQKKQALDNQVGRRYDAPLPGDEGFVEPQSMFDDPMDKVVGDMVRLGEDVSSIVPLMSAEKKLWYQYYQWNLDVMRTAGQSVSSYYQEHKAAINTAIAVVATMALGYKVINASKTKRVVNSEGLIPSSDPQTRVHTKHRQHVKVPVKPYEKATAAPPPDNPVVYESLVTDDLPTAAEGFAALAQRYKRAMIEAGEPEEAWSPLYEQYHKRSKGADPLALGSKTNAIISKLGITDATTVAALKAEVNPHTMIQFEDGVAAEDYPSKAAMWAIAADDLKGAMTKKNHPEVEWIDLYSKLLRLGKGEDPVAARRKMALLRSKLKLQLENEETVDMPLSADASMFQPTVASAVQVFEQGSPDPNTTDLLDFKLKRQLFRFKLVNQVTGEIHASAHIFFIGGLGAFAPLHAMKWLQHSTHMEILGMEKNPRLVVGVDQFRIPRTGSRVDLAVIIFDEHCGVPRFRNVISNFIRTEDLNRDLTLATLMTRVITPNGHSIDFRTSNKVMLDDMRGCSLSPDPSTKEVRPLLVTQGFYYPDIVTTPGFCGSPLVVYNTACEKGKIMGLHYLGHPAKIGGWATVLTYELLLELLRGINLDDGLLYDVPNLQNPKDLEVIATEECQVSGFEYLGEVTPDLRPYHNTQTKIVRTPLYEKFGPAKTAPAVLTITNGINPRDRAMKKNFGYNPIVSKTTMLQIEEFLVHKYRSLLKRPLRVLSQAEGWNGVPGSSIRPMVLSTSSGWPWNRLRPGGKRAWVETDEDNQVLLVDDKLQQAIDHRIAQAKIRQNVLTVWVDTLKDERRSLKKVADALSRLFANGPVDFTLVFRMYFADFTSLLMDNRDVNDCSVGINVHSSEWEILLHRLNQVMGSRWIAGDFSNFDGSIPAQFMQVVGRIVNRVYDDAPENCNVRDTLMSNIYNSVHLDGKDMYRLFKANPSGNPFTAVMNSMVNSMLMLYAWMETGHSLRDYDRLVVGCNYGDDNVLKVDESVSNFTMKDIASALATLHIKYTPAQKDDEVYDYITQDQVTYLKRKFRWDDTVNRWFAPLDYDSMVEMLYWSPAGLPGWDALEDTARSFLAEAVHYGKPFYEEWCIKLRREWENHGKTLPDSFTTWAEHVHRMFPE